jgi:transcription elongation GreA/GreB family factor
LNKTPSPSLSPTQSPSIDELHRRLKEAEDARLKHTEEMRQLREKQEAQEREAEQLRKELSKLKKQQPSGDEDVTIDMGDQVQSQIKTNSQTRPTAFSNTAFGSPLHLQRRIEELDERLNIAKSLRTTRGKTAR